MWMWFGGWAVIVVLYWARLVRAPTDVVVKGARAHVHQRHGTRMDQCAKCIKERLQVWNESTGKDADWTGKQHRTGVRI